MFRYDALKTTALTVSAGPISESFSPADAPLQSLFSAQTGSTFRSNNRRTIRKEETADVFHGALSLNGLPLAVILDGCGVAAENNDIQRSASCIMDTLESLALQLEGSQLPEEQIKELIKQEYLNLDNAMRNRTEDAVFSALVVFKNHQGELKALSFGTGDTMLALDDQVQVKTVLAAKNIQETVFLRPLPFPCPRTGTATLQRTLNNLEIDIRTVKPNDRFIFLTDGAYDHLSLKSVSSLDSEDDKLIIRRTLLQEGSLPSGISPKLIAQNAEQQAAQDFNSKASNRTLSLGDDMTAAEALIPSKEQQLELQAFLYKEAEKALTARLTDPTLPEEIKNAFNPVKNKINQLRFSPSPDLPALTKALAKTNQVIQQRDDEAVVNSYLAYTQEEVSSKSSFLWKALGAAMMVAGASLALIGGLTLAGTLGLGAAVGGSLVAGGICMAVSGAAFFASGRKKDLRTEMIEANEVLQSARSQVR